GRRDGAIDHRPASRSARRDGSALMSLLVTGKAAADAERACDPRGGHASGPLARGDAGFDPGTVSASHPCFPHMPGVIHYKYITGVFRSTGCKPLTALADSETLRLPCHPDDRPTPSRARIAGGHPSR